MLSFWRTPLEDRLLQVKQFVLNHLEVPGRHVNCDLNLLCCCFHLCWEMKTKAALRLNLASWEQCH